MVDLQVPTSLVMKRLASRRVCVDCGANYSTAAPPLVNWTCDVCGGEVVQRQDDTEEAIERRLNLYEEETAPLLDWYKERELLVEVNGTGSPDAVTRRVVGAIDALRAQGPGRWTRGGEGVRRNEDELNKMRRAGKVVAEMHEKTREAARPGVTTLELDAVAREVLERRGATSNFLELPRLPGRHLHVAQQHDRARDPGRLRARGRATSSPSIAGRSSRATTGTRRSPWASGPSRRRPRS